MWPTSRPKKSKDVDEVPDNPMEIVTGFGKTLTINWVYWQYAWEVVYSNVSSSMGNL